MSHCYYTRTATEALTDTQSSEQGLTAAEANARLARDGENSLPKSQPPSKLWRFLRQFHNVLIYVLLAATLITLSMQHYLDASVIFAVVLINAIIGYFQEAKAESALAGLRDLMAPTAVVIRAGKRMEIAASQLVVGDIVVLEAGARVPADIRLLQAHNLQLHEAVLTGESLPVTKHTAVLSEQTPLAQRTNMAYLGTWVSVGQGMGVVTAVGSATEFGNIGVMLTQVTAITTPLVAQIAVFSKRLSAVILIVAAVLLAYSMWLDLMPFGQLFMVMVSIAVAAIPEGLPAVMTITLAVGVQVMAKRNAIIRHLPSIETLGAVSVICTDKTGTLTRNEMRVAAVVASDHRFSLDSDAVHTAATEHCVAALQRIAILCNDAQIHDEEADADLKWGRTIQGDPMEGALLLMAAKLGSDIESTKQQWHRNDVIPFDAAYRYMATLDHDHQGHTMVSVKGAPEALLSMAVASTNDNYWLQQAELLARDGMRVIALAERAFNSAPAQLTTADIQGQLTMVALVGFIDPPRDEALAAVQECQRAGITVKMITGDHPVTARAIARLVGIERTETVLTGVDLDLLSDAQFAEKIATVDVFARTSPTHKLRLVKALQAQQHIVAMTGDGVNDAPAVKRADVGIVMGIRGSEAAKQAADVVLLDDNFASIVAAVRQGRTVYENLKKVISWDIPTSVGESLAIVLALMLGLAMPITPVQLLWVNLVTAVTLGLTLAFEPTEPNIMKLPPRPRNEPLLSKTLVWHLTLVSLLFVAGMFSAFHYATSNGHSLDYARTMALNTAVLFEIFHLFFIRNRRTHVFSWYALKASSAFWLAVTAVIIAQLILTYWPPMQQLFATASVTFFDVVFLLLLSFGFLCVIELEKHLRHRLLGRRL